ncbi:predicted protein [Uncinocarpus reesii 1704]|uniref:HIT-type domain-containing protein n=1 Tax=Uncinocarpus reesii (strain UAMH 1704) TaxID=336963 RepID=C4JFJ0_UNCRE|nr:uncharacterized protein UREG_01004 [Uncinocarpus reesii 1704]EEP76155.1 predicted protein [Uncinocarpus reesii 1704]
MASRAFSPLMRSIAKTPVFPRVRGAAPFSTSGRLLNTAEAALPRYRPLGAFRAGIFGFLFGSTVAGASIYYYILEEYRLSNETLTEDIYALQAATQRLSTYVVELEGKLDQLQKKNSGYPMSHSIEILSTGGSHSNAPGWAYVPDVRPSVTQPGRTGGRKRAVRDSGISHGDGSLRQQNAILKRLAEFDRDNHRDVHIPIPTKQKDTTSKGSRSKTTSNVRRILMSQKTFKNYLDDEEAAAALAPPTLPRTTAPRTGKTTLTTSKPASRTSESPPPAPPVASEPSASPLIVSEYDNDPLLRSYVPSAPSDRILQALLSEPPLSYNASRAKFPAHANRKPPRHFCGICGYWGKVKCIKCRTRVCGLDCLRVHDDTTCEKFYA